jgi:hypothetical protein
MHPRSKYPPASTRGDRSVLRLHELLDEVSRRPTRLELVCWNFNLDASRVRPAWDVALRVGLIAPAGNDRLTGEAVFGLTDRGRRAVRELRATRRR